MNKNIKFNLTILIILILTNICFLFSQFPVELSRNQTTIPFILEVENGSEFLLEFIAYSNTEWGEPNSESSTITIGIDGYWEDYNQDIILFNGTNLFNYKISLGYLSEGSHTIEFKFDYNKSSVDADFVYIESINIIDINEISIDPDVFFHSPILYGRDLLSWNESVHTDIPLIMWHEISFSGNNKIIKYSLIFSNEDSRIGIGLSDLMYNYGRTTDIEWIYEVTLNNLGEIIYEKYQGPNHVHTEFNGEKYYKHPILKNATLNCNFSDDGISNFKFFLSPQLTLNPGYTRETLMDNNPWTYAIMANELAREGSYEAFPDPETVEISDVRNYLYIEFDGEYIGNDIDYKLDIIVKLHGSCDKFYHDHNFYQFENNFLGGLNRTSIELIDSFNPEHIESITFFTDSLIVGDITINNISKIFYLNNEYLPIDIDIDFESFLINNNQNEFILEINENINQVDCFGDIQGEAECDLCDVCNGGNLDLDDCGICNGGNLDLDCNGICFGDASYDECGICEGDNSTCSGCTDINAENYNQDAVFYDGNCIYNDRKFEVPNEYLTIQDAIFYSQNGDTVIVSEGVYDENIDFLGKSILVKSLYENIDSISNYVISGTDSLSTITISNQENFSGLYGFTIMNGYGHGVSFEDFVSLAANSDDLDSLLSNVIRGGGISIIESNPHIKDVYIRNNTSRNVGAGIAMVNSDAIIESVIISDNIINDGDALGGGGIAINGGNPIINNVEIFNNYVGGNMYYLNGGGGVLCGFSFDDNQLSLNIENSKIYSNTANIGAGIGALSGDINIYKSIISSNTGDYGAAISMGEPLGLIVGNINMNLLNTTIVNNSGMITIGLINSAFLNINNSISWSNIGEYEITNLPNNNELNIYSSHSLFQTEIIGDNNIFNSDPLFINDSIFDYRLQAHSPCIDSGIGYYELDGEIITINESEYYGLAPDIGAYEYNPLSIDRPAKILPIEYLLQDPYPNPFNPSTIINYILPNISKVQLEVFDINGKLISTLYSGFKSAGNHTIEWNASNSPSGVYFVRFDAGKFTQTKKLILVK